MLAQEQAGVCFLVSCLGRVLGPAAASGDWDPLQTPCLLSQQSSNSKKDKDALEDKRRNPILKYIGKPKSSSQSSESGGRGAVAWAGAQPRAHTPLPISAAQCPLSRACGSPRYRDQEAVLVPGPESRNSEPVVGTTTRRNIPRRGRLWRQ